MSEPAPTAATPAAPMAIIVTPPAPPTPRKPPLWRAALATAMIVDAGIVVCAAFSYSDDFGEGLSRAAGLFACGGPLIAAVFFAVALLALKVMHWLMPWMWNRALVITFGVFLALLCVGGGHLASRPTEIFRRFVLDPVPPGVTNVQYRKTTSFSDGFSVIVAFDAPPAAFDAIRLAHGLQPIDATEDGEFFHDRPIYVKPARPEFFVGKKTRAVRDAASSRVYLYLDRYERRTGSGR